MLMSQHIERDGFGIRLCFSVFLRLGVIRGFILSFNCENVTSDNNATLKELFNT